MLVPVTKIQKFCTYDGPGVRTTVFLKGCPLRCAWCHNPETQSARPDFFYIPARCIGCGACAAVCPVGVHRLENGVHLLDRERCTRCMRCTSVCVAKALEPCAREMSVEEILQEVKKDSAFYGKEGGVTLSGGEPLMHPQAALTLLRSAKEAGLHTAVETCGYFDKALVEELVPLVDLFLWDLKDTDDTRHRGYTGVSSVPIRENLACVDACGGVTRLRCILVRTVNMEEAHYEAIAACYHSLSHCEGVELLPYHAYGGSKAQQLGGEDNGRPEWIPSERDMKAARRFLRQRNVKVL